MSGARVDHGLPDLLMSLSPTYLILHTPRPQQRRPRWAGYPSLHLSCSVLLDKAALQSFPSATDEKMTIPCRAAMASSSENDQNGTLSTAGVQIWLHFFRHSYANCNVDVYTRENLRVHKKKCGG